MRISEIFRSIQGEGRLVGTPSLFIRTSGCNLRCVWCDTPYTSWRPEGTSWPLAKILARIDHRPAKHVVITGGEPMLAPEIEDLAWALRRRNKHVTIETAGTIFKAVPCDLLSLSPKLTNSTPWKREKGKFAAMHDGRRLNYSALQNYLDGYDYQLKFVVEAKEDFAEIRGLVDRLKNVDPSRILIMAQGTTTQQLSEKTEWIVDQCLRHGYCFTPRLHIELFGNR
ncbi:MAG TPA: 7-carboxy-7-deazaguanine synthase QueE, partial [Candidatus Binatia bacterium]|nr:7-carboxy-7-deazaguanine synthase QueE [Candidatus Binatia bacterium]